MRPALRQPLVRAAALAGLAALTGCGAKTEARPPAKPASLSTTIAAPGAAGDRAALTTARISTKSGQILILEPDGSVTSMDLDSAAGRSAFAVSDADLAALDDKPRPDPAGAGATRPKGPTAQQRAIAAFARRTRPALPDRKEGSEISDKDFLGARVKPLGDGKRSDLVEVTANLRQGVDADIAFSYATCALAGWAKANGARYGRHIRTLQDTRDGKLLIGAAFTISDSKPLGLRVMETNETLRECKARGIPAA
ncbi:MAG: hypothetical protein NZ734_00640 [Paracoccus sp.]|nr:hypothetical protein [Paracoccus sp. (in: a-proteobacteria)]